MIILSSNSNNKDDTMLMQVVHLDKAWDGSWGKKVRGRRVVEEQTLEKQGVLLLVLLVVLVEECLFQSHQREIVLHQVIHQKKKSLCKKKIKLNYEQKYKL